MSCALRFKPTSLCIFKMDVPLHTIVIRSKNENQGTLSTLTLIDCQFCFKLQGASKLFLWNVLRVYSWIFQAVLCLLAIAVSLATYVTGSGDLVIPWVAFHGPNQAGILTPGPADKQAALR